MTAPRLSDVPDALFDDRRPRIQRYMDLVIGERGWGALVRYELVMLCSAWVPGALGLLLRAKLYPLLLGACGRNVSFGVNVTLRHPRKIRIQDDVAIDDGCVLDAKGAANQGIQVGRRVFLGRNSILACKDGDIVLEDGVNVSYNCAVFSASSVRIGPRPCSPPTATWSAAGTTSTSSTAPWSSRGAPRKGSKSGQGAGSAPARSSSTACRSATTPSLALTRS